MKVIWKTSSGVSLFNSILPLERKKYLIYSCPLTLNNEDAGHIPPWILKKTSLNMQNKKSCLTLEKTVKSSRNISFYTTPLYKQSFVGFLKDVILKLNSGKFLSTKVNIFF